jgi:2-methylcitrate dehydratase PrpD
MPSHYHFWHTTGTCGGFGAAAAAGKLLNLNEDQLVDALGNAGSQAAGLWEFLEDNAMTKYLHCGKAASNGILAALLAEKGFTGAKKIIEGNRGFVKATSNGTNPEEKFASLGLEYKILETSFKPYASCRHTHATIGAIINLREKYRLNPENVEKMTIHVYEVATQIAQNNEKYEDARAAKFSLVFCAAAALYYGRLPVSAFSPEALKNQAVLGIAKNTTIHIDEECNKAYPEKWMAKVSVRTRDKKVYEGRMEYPKGDPENPFTEQDFIKKFMDLAVAAVNQDQAKSLLARCKGVEEVQDMSNLFTSL